jgi:hypothetical protein
MKILEGKLKPNIIYLIDIALIVLRQDELARIQSAIEGHPLLRALNLSSLPTKKSEEFLFVLTGHGRYQPPAVLLRTHLRKNLL